MKNAIYFVLALAMCSAGGCQKKAADECIGSGRTGTCPEACENLFAKNCRVGSSREECAEVCGAATADLNEPTKGRVLACYAAAESCVEADGCGRACGVGDGPVVFESVDAGSATDGGSDATTDE